MIIYSCICYDLTFSEILEKCEIMNIKSVEEINEELGICDRCCMCNPYITESLKNGITRFENIIL